MLISHTKKCKTSTVQLLKSHALAIFNRLPNETNYSVQHSIKARLLVNDPTSSQPSQLCINTLVFGPSLPSVLSIDHLLSPFTELQYKPQNIFNHMNYELGESQHAFQTKSSG
jgi:hypothetical protein